MNAVYPNGDNMRDIPDYTEMMPDWVWRYYEQSGDKSVLADSYDALKTVANYIKANVATTGNAAGLVYNLFGGASSYSTGSSTGRRRCATATRSTTTPRGRSTTRTRSARCATAARPRGARQARGRARCATAGRTI